MVILGQEPKAYLFRAISHALDIYLEGNILLIGGKAYER